ncbi:MAG: hypothetical protein IH975_04385 [Nitrospinae bacterium]|nr:hypothetical protein [Nitrospinota bacterium]
MAEKENAEKKPLPPYVSYKTFKSFIEGLRIAMPGRIDRSLMGTMSGIIQSQVLTSLRYLNLVSAKGIPKESLNRLVNSEGPGRQKTLREILLGSYPFLSEGGFELERATFRQLEEEFAQLGASGDTIRKGVAFFISAAKDADLPLSPYFDKKSKAPRKTMVRTKPKSKERKRTDEDIETQHTEQLSWEQLLLSKFPSFDPAWPDDVKSKWFDAFSELMKRGEEQEGKKVGP